MTGNAKKKECNVTEAASVACVIHDLSCMGAEVTAAPSVSLHLSCAIGSIVARENSPEAIHTY